jgi:non-specific protein-tyrosine kinase
MLGAQFTRFIDEAERPAPGKDPGVRITVTDDPALPSRPVSPRPLLNLAVGALIGLVAGTVGAVLREHSDTSVRSRKVLREATGSATIGIIGHDRGVGRRPLVAGSGADSPAAEAFRSLRTVLQFADGGHLPASLAITSAVAGEGKSTVACNLAVTLAEAGWRVVLVDADLRTSRAAGYLGADGPVGLSDVLRGTARMDDALRECGPGALSVLPGGPVPPNPSELLASEEMLWVLGELRSRADIVLVDTPALLPVTDAAILAKACAGTVLVTRYGRTRREQVVRAVEQLRAVDVTLLGAVLNGVPAGELDADRGAPRRAAADRPGVAAGRP